MKARILAMCVSSAVAVAASSAMAAPSAWWAPYTTDDNTIGLWNFDLVTGPTGTFADSSGNGNNGTLSVYSPPTNITLSSPVTSGAGTGPGTGQFGTALNYAPSVSPLPGDGNTIYNWGTVSNSSGQFAPAAASFTVEAWIKPTAADLGSVQDVYFLGDRSNTGGWNFGTYQGKLIGDFTLKDTSGGGLFTYDRQGNATLSAGTWYHVALVGDQTDSTHMNITLYINGAVDAQYLGLTGVAFAGSTADLILGNRGSSNAAALWQGQIDEARYSDVARTFGAAPLPEPASLTLLALGGLALVRRRRR